MFIIHGTVPKMPFRLITLGSPTELAGGDGAPFKFSNTKHLALLAYLTLEPGDYSREELTKFIWSSGDPGSMNDALSTLRGVFGKEIFAHRAQRVQFDPTLVDCDAAKLLSARTDQTGTSAVLALYRGPFLADFNERGAGYRLMRWVEQKRKELERTFLTLCDEACREAADRQAWEELREIAKQGLRHVPEWGEGARWLAAAENSMSRGAPPEALPAVALPEAAAPLPHSEPAPVPGTAGGLKPVAVPAERRPDQRILIGVVALLLITLAGVWGWRGRSGAAGDGDERGVRAGTGTGARAKTPLCEPGEASGVLVDEVFYYGTRVRPGRPFRKAWVLQNIGPCTWGTDFRLHYVESSSERLSRTMMDSPLRKLVLPGQRDTFEVPMQAPITPGIHSEIWELRDGGDQPVRIGNGFALRAGVKVPLPHYPPCRPGEGAGLMLVRKFPPGIALEPGARFRYSWTIKNTAECAWGPGTFMRFRSHEIGRISREDRVQATQAVEPDETYTFLVHMEAPRRSGIYSETWELIIPAGTPIPVGGSPSIGVQIRIADEGERPTPAPICHPGEAQIQFFDENWRDSTRVRPGQTLTKRWTVVNNGRCTWGADFRLRYTGFRGAQLAVSRDDRPLGENVPPETAYTFEVPMRVPDYRGFIREDWRFVDAAGNQIMIGTSPYLAALLTVEPDSKDTRQ